MDDNWTGDEKYEALFETWKKFKKICNLFNCKIFYLSPHKNNNKSKKIFLLQLKFH